MQDPYMFGREWMVFRNKKLKGSFRPGIIFKQQFSQPSYIYQESVSSSSTWKVCFTPTSRCLPLILTAIKEAKESIQFQRIALRLLR